MNVYDCLLSTHKTSPEMRELGVGDRSTNMLDPCIYTNLRVLIKMVMVHLQHLVLFSYK